MNTLASKSKKGLVTFSTRSYPTFGRQRRPFNESQPPKTVTDSPYYWWFMFLRLNTDYKKTCDARGKGKFADLYKDFGNVHTVNFKDWWQAKVELFAEPKQGYRMLIAKSTADLAPFDSDEVINLVVPLNRSQRSIKKAFSNLVLKKLEKGLRGVSVEKSEAKYRLSGKWHIEALSLAYKVYTLKKQSQKDNIKIAWADIGIEAKLPMSFALTKESRKINAEVRRTLTILALRHYKRAEEFIKSTTTQTFPYTQ